MFPHTVTGDAALVMWLCATYPWNAEREDLELSDRGDRDIDVNGSLSDES